MGSDAAAEGLAFSAALGEGGWKSCQLEYRRACVRSACPAERARLELVTEVTVLPLRRRRVRLGECVLNVALGAGPGLMMSFQGDCGRRALAP